MMNKEDKAPSKKNKKKNLTLNFDDKDNPSSNNRTGINYIPDKEIK
ncbi:MULTISPECIES: hypothetical protein [unclassified Polaribacter]|jgi:hypothetical protein|nr:MULTISPECIES: hypothetical protein [unclassified Polaribacter]QXP62242.1 hypothetical protein H0I27_10110 [Polaribacter sp. HaHaR_3_91]QXP67997.1 hypothetical protein H0I28_05710 [Polaribacter sp. AHE13PA]QXP70165.1 hypothetical protein H0I29_16350 [Polaribacter sp. R2A056_3_33]